MLLTDWPVSHIDLAARHAWLTAAKADVGALMADPDAHDAKVAGWWWWGICQWIGGEWCSAPSSKRPHLANNGMGIHSAGQRPHLGDNGFFSLAERLCRRLRATRITCCDWGSVRSSLRLGSSVGVFLDPPYTKESGRKAALYGTEDLSVGHEVAAWAVEASADPRLKIALCGIDGEYEIPVSWHRHYWKTSGFSYGDRNRGEVIWFSPSCSSPQGVLL